MALVAELFRLMAQRERADYLVLASACLNRASAEGSRLIAWLKGSIALRGLNSPRERRK